MKNYVVITLIAAIVALGLVSCSSTPKEVRTPPPEPVTKPIKPAPETAEKLIWTSHEKRPAWTVSEPDINEGNVFFVGLSGKYALEKDGRDDAHRDATNKVVKYIGSFVQSKYERIMADYGLSSTVVDPSRATRQFEQQLASAFATRVKAKEWYLEKWDNPKFKETYYLAYVLAQVPESAIDKTYQENLDNQVDDLKKKRDAANDEKAKTQFENAMKAFEDAKKQGFSLEEEKK
jgi:hypothetical protein